MLGWLREESESCSVKMSSSARNSVKLHLGVTPGSAIAECIFALLPLGYCDETMASVRFGTGHARPCSRGGFMPPFQAAEPAAAPTLRASKSEEDRHPASLKAAGCAEQESGANVLISRHSLWGAASPEPPCFPQGATAQYKQIHERLTESVQEDKSPKHHGHVHSLPVSRRH